MRTNPFGNSGNWSLLFKCNSLKNEKLFHNSLVHLWNVHQILNIFKKKMIVIANASLKFQNVKDLFKPLSRKRHFRASFDSQRVNGCQTVVKSAWEHFYHIFWWLSEKMLWKISPILNFEILGAFVKTLPAMRTIPLGILGICSSLLKCNYLKNKKLLWIFCSIYGISMKI